MHSNPGRSIVLTGATGFLGAFLMAGLLEKGNHVTVLGRSSNGRSLDERLSALVSWFGIDPPCDRLLPVEVDFNRKHFGLEDAAYSSLCTNAGKVIHCASDTSFSERNRTRVIDANVNSLYNLLEFVSDASAGKLFYISSAYASGVHEGICMEAPVFNASFTNVYEESKALAENIIISACERNAVPLSILRPSIVFGHSRTGMSLKFNALYYAVKSLLVIRDIFVKDIIQQGGERSREWGFHLDSDQILYMPLNIRLKNIGAVNLIPVDYFVEAALSIIGDAGSNGIYHITAGNPPSITTLVEYAERFLRIRGVRLVLDNEIKGGITNPAEELFDKFIEQYLPYLSDQRIFDRSRMNIITQGLTDPPFNYEVFRRCMDYVLDNNWGRKNGFPC